MGQSMHCSSVIQVVEYVRQDLMGEMPIIYRNKLFKRNISDLLMLKYAFSVFNILFVCWLIQVPFSRLSIYLTCCASQLEGATL